MVVVSYSGKEINAKLVYYGAGLSGKTTNLEAIYEAVPETSRGKMVSMKTQSDRTLFFDLLPLDLGEIMGFKTRFLLYTVPGQVFYNATRKLVLKGADAIVFVADSGVGKMDENKESFANLRTNLQEYGLRLEDIPCVLQYNKRDLPNAYSLEELNKELNADGRLDVFEAVATQGVGVFETFRGVSHELMQKVTRELRRTSPGSAASRAKQPDAARPVAADRSAPPLTAPVGPAVAPPSVTGPPAPPAPSEGRTRNLRLKPEPEPFPSAEKESDVPSISALGPSQPESHDRELRPGGPREEAGEKLPFTYGREIAPKGEPGISVEPWAGGGGAKDEGREDEPPVSREPALTHPSARAKARAFSERTLTLEEGGKGAPPDGHARAATPIVVPVKITPGAPTEIVLRIVITTEG